MGLTKALDHRILFQRRKGKGRRRKKKKKKRRRISKEASKIESPI